LLAHVHRPGSCALTWSARCLPAGDKLRSELASTSAELQQVRSTSYEMAKQGEELRLQLGGVKQSMAKTSTELEKEQETAAAMKERVSKMNQNFIQTSECPVLPGGAAGQGSMPRRLGPRLQVLLCAL
jgi:septal ring factor EnvC (AmiA/AmiB activator)